MPTAFCPNMFPTKPPSIASRKVPNKKKGMEKIALTIKIRMLRPKLVKNNLKARLIDCRKPFFSKTRAMGKNIQVGNSAKKIK